MPSPPWWTILTFSESNKYLISLPLKIVSYPPLQHSPSNDHALMTQTLRDMLKPCHFSMFISEGRVYLLPYLCPWVAHTPVVTNRMSWKPHSLGLGVPCLTASCCHALRESWKRSPGSQLTTPDEQMEAVPTVSLISKDIQTSELTQGVPDIMW